MKASSDLATRSSDHAQTPSPNSPAPDSRTRPGENGGDASESQADEFERSPAPGSVRRIEILLRLVEEVHGSSPRLIEVYAGRTRPSVRRTIVQASIGACVAVCGWLWVGAATLATLRGVRGGLTAVWSGREWLGDLTGGALALALAASAIGLHLRLSSRREVRRSLTKHERNRNERDRNQDPEPSCGF